ncbi:ABC transporter permease [Moraxella osloensis]|nr:methionine ABC transporter permease [Moraxella osloensis]QQU06974.1 ABC transporter permease [Moraxella osloensis]
MLELLLTGLIDTLIMVGVSAILAFLLGLPIALVLVNSSEQGIAPSFLTNLSLGWSVNIVRAIPFLILMVAIIPATRMIVGTSYGVWAAVVPLTLAATPFFARIAEVILREVDPGLIEAAQAIGCNRTQIIQHVLLPEALPGIIAGFTVTLVTMINSSAIAGAIGAGGLGDIAYRYGYQRFDVQMMVLVIVILVALVMLVQATGDSLSQWVDKRQL